MSGVFERLDPRARLLSVTGGIVAVSSTAPAWLAPFPWYAALVFALALLSKASWLYLIWRMLAASPFVLLASALLVFQGGFTRDAVAANAPAALAVCGKGFLAVLLLALLTSTTPLADLLWALRTLGVPRSLGLILGMMYRYTGLFSEEYARMERARACRSVRPLGWNRFAIYGHQFGSLMLRSWDRADRVHSAMLARGFNGEWPTQDRYQFGFADGAFVLLAVAAFVAVRALV